ncbi:hypothetical protein A9Z64_09220 [Moraxella osloensis]|uniref:Uncharacterized protein n=1 Tax=Faucicola osloensis TaxID=34062 RepID=A0A378Q933_FAUOS|nr:hypothetical protein [Moraxella osloensis]AME00675.1 hypothetical protein AXE82_01890 [Moraxella osloensis]OBX54940.1 hypothetical protein A9Z64_09220 [Moraxella osloensis]QPT41733.1 hypothetical protein I6G27_06955 [Moraxella osloensis]STY97311.1 Uncharacterised protein [Moraxella osloensis]
MVEVFSFSKLSISKFGLICSIFFIIFTVIARFILPFGDEPDFEFRLNDLIYTQYTAFSPYNYVHDTLNGFNYINTCSINASPTSLWATIDYTNCRENLYQILSRISITLIIYSPILLLICFRNLSYIICNTFSIKQLSKQSFENRLDAISLTIIFPSFIYLSGILAKEQLTLALAVFLIAFLESWIIVSFILFIIAGIDLGNATVYATFVSIFYFFKFIQKKWGNQYIIAMALLLVIFAFIIGSTILDKIPNLNPLSDKIEAMKYKNENLFIDEYPKIFRPVITLISGIFMSSSGIKVIPLYIIIFPSLLIGYIKLKSITKNSFLEIDKLYLLAAITTILFFIFLFPDYSYAKYYIFLLPLFFAPFLIVFDRIKILYFNLILVIIWLLNLFIYTI